MNYHIMVDEKFIDSFIKDAESVSANNTNRYFIRGKKQNAIHVKDPRAEWIEDFWGNEFKNILSRIENKDKIFIHYYHLNLGQLMLTINKNIPIYAVPFGGDFYEDPYLYNINWVHDPITLKYVKYNNIYFKSIPLHPLKLIKNIYWRLNYKNIAKKEIEIKKLTVQRLNYLLIESELSIEYDLIKNTYVANNLMSLPFYYNLKYELAKTINDRKTSNDKVNILVGNSATPASNHVDCLMALKIFKKESPHIIKHFKGKLIKINGNRSVKKVFVDIKKKLNEK